MTAPTLTRRLVRLVGSRPVNTDDLAATERYVRDWLASYVAGRRAPVGARLRAYGEGRRELESRVFLAAALSHVTETDDLHRASTTHPGCVVVPTAFLLGRQRDADGPAVLEAVLAGYEVMLRIGESLGPGHYRTFHNTATAGVFGAAAAAARLLDLDEDARVHALGSAGTQAGGLWQFNAEGAMSKPLHAGHAAAAGLRAALLAAAGFTGAEAILEGDRGFYRGFCPDPRPDAVLRLAPTWKLPETSLKPYPCCRHTHPVIDAALDVRADLEEADVSPGALRDVRIGTYGAALGVTDRPDPRTPHAARFSLQYCAAVAILDGSPGLDSFAPERVVRDDVRGLLERVSVESDGELDEGYPERWGGAVEARSVDGRTFPSRHHAARGDPEEPLDDAELDAKVRGLFEAGAVTGAAADDLLRRCRELISGGTLFDLPGPHAS